MRLAWSDQYLQFIWYPIPDPILYFHTRSTPKIYVKVLGSPFPIFIIEKRNQK